MSQKTAPEQNAEQMERQISSFHEGHSVIDKRAQILLLIILYLPCLFIHLDLDNDIWFLLSSGRFVVQNGIPFVEPLTMHANMNFMMQQWLSAVVFWGVYSKLGALGLIALCSLVFAAIITVVYRISNLLSKGNFVTSFLVSFFASTMLSGFIVTRPIIFTLLLLISEFYFLERYIDSKKAAFLIPLPLLSALFINLHAAMWPMQFVVLLPYFIDSFHFKILRLEGQGYPKIPLLISVVLMLAAGFTNPYGIRAMTYLFRSYGFAEIGFISEMQPANINTTVGKVVFATFLFIAAIYYFYRNGKTKLRFILLTLGTTVLALSALRSFVVFLICSIFPLAYYLKDMEPPKGKIKQMKNVLLLRSVLILLVVAELGFVGYSRYEKYTTNPVTPTVAPAVEYLSAHESKEGMSLYIGYNEGGYAEFLGFKPYIDPRAEVFLKKNNDKADIMKEYVMMQLGSIYYPEVLDKYAFTHLVVSTEDILYNYLPHDENYTLIFEDEEYTVYRKIIH